MNISTLQPAALWKIFDLFTQHPRPSKHEEAVLCAIENLCDEHKLAHQRDKIGNLIIRKPATLGMEQKQTVVMQGHIDMVPQKNADSSHDFIKDPIRTQLIEDEHGLWVTADGTTLGADNGIGVAAALAVLISDDIEHGPLEVLITIDEEAGMTGAEHLQPGWLNADILLNLDTEDEGELYVGCAGGVDISAQIPMTQEQIHPDHIAFELALTGLRGGHSGLNINDCRGNANKLINRFLLENAEALSLQISRFNGGTLRNAIARESFTNVVIPSDKQTQLAERIHVFLHTIQQELGSVEPTISLTANPIDLPEQVYTTNSAKRVISSVAACIHGVTRMSADFNHTVESSNNLAIVQSEGDHVTILCLARSLSDTARDDLGRSIAATFELAGANTKLSGHYPGWKPNADSKILTTCSDVHEKAFGYKPEVKVIHAGLECGLLGKPYPHWDMISFGPNIRHAHSPDEKVSVPSVKWFWDYLLEVLKAIPNKN